MIKKLIQKLMNTNNNTNTNTIEVMKEGTVKFFNNAKGFGFIKLKDSEDEIFVHTTNLIDDISENDNVQFDVEQGDKGLSAIRVSLIK
jgi:CspA family cold shock protein